MKVKEMRELISKLKGESQIQNQTVEFVVDAKKFFASDVKAGTDTMAIEITRENYRPLSIDAFESSLALASGDLEIQVLQGNNAKGVSEHYLTDMALELVVS